MVLVDAGKFYSPSSRQQLAGIFSTFLESGHSCIIIHFHGGLVDQDTAIGYGAELQALYGPAAATLFLIWRA